MAPSHVLVGDIEVVPLLDALTSLGELTELYPEQSTEDWRPYRELYPELFAGTQWRVPCFCYVLRAAGTTILVDTGLGPPGLVDWELEREGELPKALGEVGVDPGEVDLVFLTHLHIDHLGWNTDERGEIFFPRARYLVHRDALAFARERRELPHIRRCVEPLVDRFETLDGAAELVDGITAIPLLGHCPGHMGLRIDSGGHAAVLVADAAVHPALLDRPEWRYVSDDDHSRSEETRRALVEDHVERDVLVVSGHYPRGGIGRLRRHEGRVVWEAA